MNKFTSNYIPVVLFTKILTIDFARKRKLTILFLFTKILTRILLVKFVVTLREVLPTLKCKMFKMHHNSDQ